MWRKFITIFILFRLASYTFGIKYFYKPNVDFITTHITRLLCVFNAGMPQCRRNEYEHQSNKTLRVNNPCPILKSLKD
jgi:hypothetical protein